MGENRLVIIVMASAFGLLLLWTAWTEQRFHHHALDFVWQQHTTLTSDAISSMTSVVQAVNITLVSAVSALERHDIRDPDQYQHILSQLREYVSVTPGVTSLIVFDEKGDSLIHSRYDSAPVSMSATASQYFRFFADGVAKDRSSLFIGEPVKGASEDEWLLMFSRPLIDLRGQFSGVVLATVSLDILGSYVHNLSERAAGSQVALVTEVGTIIAAAVPGTQKSWVSQPFRDLMLPLPKLPDSTLTKTTFETTYPQRLFNPSIISLFFW